MTASVNRPPPLSSWQEVPAPELPASHGDGGWGQAVFWPLGAHWRGVMWLLVIFCAYSAVVLLSMVLASDGVALLWLPNAVLVTALLKFRPRDWPYVYAAGLLAEVIGDLRFDVAPHQGLYFGVVNAIEATIVVICAAYIAGGPRNIGLLSVRGASAIVLASITVPALTGAIGAIGSVWTFDAVYFTAWQTWWFGDSLGLLAGIPIGLLLRDARRSVARRRSALQALVGGVGAALLCVLSGVLAVTDNTWGAQQTALATAVLLALTFGAVGAPTAAVLMTAVTLTGLAREEGLASVARDQTLLFVIFAAIYAIAATTESADRAMRQLSRVRNDLSLLSRTDELTGMSNRRVLSENLDLLWAWSARESKPVAMLMVDIDFFHQYNATYGHVAGDSVLRRMGPVIQGAARRKTDLVVRYGGEEFLIVLPDAKLDDATRIAEQLHEEIHALNIEHSSSPVAPIVTVSIGALEIAKTAPESAVMSLDRCDALLFEAKKTGRNRTVAGRLQPSPKLPEVDSHSAQIN